MIHFYYHINLYQFLGKRNSSNIWLIYAYQLHFLAADTSSKTLEISGTVKCDVMSLVSDNKNKVNVPVKWRAWFEMQMWKTEVQIWKQEQHGDINQKRGTGDHKRVTFHMGWTTKLKMESILQLTH
jgi:hypothetical protein